MRLPHIYRFYLSLTSPRRVGVRVLACTARRGGEREEEFEGEVDAAKTREKICGMPVERRKTSAGMTEGKESKPRADPSYGIRFYLVSQIYLITSIIPIVLGYERFYKNYYPFKENWMDLFLELVKLFLFSVQYFSSNKRYNKNIA